MIVYGSHPRIPSCPECGSAKTVHCGHWDQEGNPEAAWFECLRCEHRWSDFQLSEELLNVRPTPPRRGTTH